jgi:hypothetical protein
MPDAGERGILRCSVLAIWEGDGALANQRPDVIANAGPGGFLHRPASLATRPPLILVRQLVNVAPEPRRKSLERISDQPPDALRFLEGKLFCVISGHYDDLEAYRALLAHRPAQQQSLLAAFQRRADDAGLDRPASAKRGRA